MSILGLIPCRGGSRRLPRKNIKLLCGRPLVAWAILEAQKSPFIDRLVVSTEDPEIEEVARERGCDVIKRPVTLAHDRSSVYRAIEHTIQREGLKDEDSVCLMQATSPLLLAEDINRSVETHLAKGRPTMTVELGQNVANGAVYCGQVKWLKDGGHWDIKGEGEPLWVAMPPDRSVDINYPEDFRIAEQLMMARMAA